MTIAIDLDRTWTADPIAWAGFYHTFTSRRHTVVMATGRDRWSDDMIRYNLPAPMKIYYTAGKPKEEAMLAQGVKVDVWIDDEPGVIQAPRKVSQFNDTEL